MRFAIEQRFAADADAVARAYADPALYETIPSGPKLAAPELVAHEVDGDVVRLQLRYRFIGDLSSAARAVVDPSRLSWVEHSEHDVAGRSSTFTLRPDAYADRLRCSGRLVIEPVDGGCRRRGEGDLKVRAPLVGSTVERTLVADLQAHLHDEVALVEAFLRR